VPEISIPESPFVVLTELQTEVGGVFEETYIVRVVCGDVTVFKRKYKEWEGYSGMDTAHDLEAAKEKALNEFGTKLRDLLGEPK